MIRDEQRARCIKAMDHAMRALYDDPMCSEPDFSKEATAAFDALHGLARIVPVKATPLEKEIAEYMRVTPARIAAPWRTATDLKTWWFSQREKDMRASLVIVGSTTEHQLLYRAFIARKGTLAAASHIKSADE